MSIETWKQKSGIEIEEVEFDGGAHGFKIYVNGKYVLMIYAGTVEDTEDIRASLNAGEDVRDIVDGAHRDVHYYLLSSHYGKFLTRPDRENE